MTFPLPEPEATTDTTTDVEALWRRIAWCGQKHPTEDLQRAQSLPEPLTPILLRTIREVVADPHRFAPELDFNGMIFGFMLLAQFREPLAFPLAIQFLSFDKEILDDLVGEMIPDDFTAVLASTFSGDLGALKGVYENESLDEFVRITALRGMASLVRHGRLSRSELSAYVGEVMGRLVRKQSWVWEELVSVAADFQLEEHRVAILNLYDEGLAEEWVDTKACVEARFLVGIEDRDAHRYRLIQDVSAETRWWACFDEKVRILDIPRRLGQDDRLIEEEVVDEPALPFVREAPKVGRNDPCPCGSGKKSKKCCGG